MDKAMTKPWTQEELDTVRRLAQEGKSASQIALQLNNRTRNSVIGVMHRRGVVFSIRKNPLVIKKKEPKPVPTVKLKTLFSINKNIEKESPYVQLPEAAYSGKDIVAFLDRKNSQCKFIVNKKEDGHYCCGSPVYRNGWCRYHFAIVYRPADPKPVNRNGRGSDEKISRSSK